MDFRHIRSFLSVAETLHFGRSARLLNLSQPALSLRVKALEDELGVQLLSRNRQGTELTAAGLAFREDAAIALEKLEFAKRKAQWASAGKLGHIRIGFISTAGFEIVPNLMRRFRKSYPDVDFSIRNILTGPQLDMIGDGLLDVGFLRLPIENRKEIVVTTVHKEPFVAILPAGHLLSAKKEIRLRELKGNPFVMYAREYAPGFHDLLTGTLSRAGVVPKVVQTAGEMPTLISLVDAGVGVSIVPASVAKRIVSRVVVCSITDRLPESEIGLAFARQNTAAVVRRFCEFARTSLSH
ncbi:MAG TPA: LysR family transcriptional regulator [Terracidiphilus sp.]|jgi:DNA-binding transcriptional LysR family regulator